MSQPLNVAVVGATGSVGEALVGLLDERDFPLHRLHLLASAESAGQRMGFAESSLRVGDVDSFDFSSVGLAFFAAAAEVSRAHAERARAAEELASIGTLVAGLAHEIGTPMGVIQGHARMLESSLSEEKDRWRLKTIQGQIGRIANIIQALLNMARPGKTARVPVALEPLLENTLSFLGEKFARRLIEVRRAFDPVPSVKGDTERLQQLFLNLFLNAADAMPDGGELSV